MKAESLYIQKLTYDENTGNEIIGLFPSEANPAIVSSYTYEAKRMGGAPTLTATIYSSEPLQWKKEEFVEYNGDRFFASYTPNSTKDNSSRMWKSEITFTSRRELLDNTLFFDVVVDDVDTQNKDRYRSNQTKFTFGGTIHEFVARINSSMAYCGLYRPTDEHKGYYVVIDEGYGTDEVKEVSFEDQYLTDVLQLINTTFELDYYWDGNVCHVGKVQHDLTDTPIKYGSSDALISVSKENANYKIVDMITGYGSSDNLPYYYPNDDEFGEAVFNTENISKDKVSVELSKFLKDSRYNDTLVLYKSKEEKNYTGSIDVSPPAFYIHSFTYPENLSQADSQSNPTVMCDFTIDIPISAIKGQEIDLTNLNFSFELFNYIQRPDFITNVSNASKSIFVWKKGEEQAETISKDVSFGSVSTYTFKENGDFTLQIAASFTYNSKVFNSDGIKTFYGASVWNVAFGGSVEFSYKPKSEYEWKNGDKYIPYSDAGINVSVISEANCIEYDYQFVKDSDRYGFNKVYTGTEDNAVKVMVTDRVWIAPSSVLMPSIYRNTKGAERFYYALNNTHKLPSGSGYYEFVNLYKKGNPHQGTVTFDDIKPTINGIVNAEGQLFGEIADIAFDKEDSDVKDSDGKYIHNYFYIKLHKFNGDFGFDLFAHALASEPAKINLIKSNGCPACSFVIGCYWDSANNKCYNNVLTDGNGNLKSDSGKMNSKGDYILSDTYVKDNKSNQDSTKEELWICVQKDTSTLGIVMPNASAGFKPQKGDLFVITGIKPPKVLVTAAEKRLDDALIKHMSENNTDQFNYPVKFSRVFLQENPDFASKLNENAKLSIQIQSDSDNDGNLISHEVFVSNYSVKVDNEELAEVEIELVNSLEVTKSDVKQIIDAVKGETVKSLSSMAGGSNTNSFNASITDKMYLSKLTDDIASGTITFQKVQKFVQGFFLGHSNEFSIDGSGNAILSSVLVNLLKSLDFNEAEQSGFAIKQRSDGKFQMLLTDLIVWGKAIFNTLLIRELSYVGGNIVLSPAAGKISYIKEVYSETTNEMIGWKCYLLADDGTTATINSFKVEDQVRCKTFNIAPGVYENVSNRDYWRLVTKVSTENEVITDDEGHALYDGKKFAWIQIAKDNCMEGSDIPASGDTIVLMGNRSDKSRQHLLMMETEGDSAPRFTMYRGINTYSLKDKSIFDVSFDGINIVSKYFNMVSVSGEKVWTPVYRGDWKEGTEYSYYDEVTWLGTRWLCISPEEQTTTDEPSEDSPYWKATTNVYTPKLYLYTDIVNSGIAIGETHNITCKLMLGDKDVSNGVASWKVTRKTDDSLDDAAWATKDKVKNFNGSIDIVWSNDGTEDDIGKGDTAKFIFTATTTTGKIHQEYIKV
nr:MAG TPA: tail protein [Caudoviricetes sp.]